MTHKCEINLKLSVYMDCKNEDDLIKCYCLPETIAHIICDEITDEKTVVTYEHDYRVTDV